MSFLSLPTELRFQILAYLNNLDRRIYAPTTHNTRHALRQVHPWFRSQIRNRHLRDLVLAAEDADAIPKGYLVCHTCFRIFPEDRFGGVRSSYRFRGDYYRFSGEAFYTLIKPKQTCPDCCGEWMMEEFKDGGGCQEVVVVVGNREKKKKKP